MAAKLGAENQILGLSRFSAGPGEVKNLTSSIWLKLGMSMGIDTKPKNNVSHVTPRPPSWMYNLIYPVYKFQLPRTPV